MIARSGGPSDGTRAIVFTLALIAVAVVVIVVCSGVAHS